MVSGPFLLSMHFQRASLVFSVALLVATFYSPGGRVHCHAPDLQTIFLGNEGVTSISFLT